MTDDKQQSVAPVTEGVHPRGAAWAQASTLDALDAFAQADREAVAAVAKAHGQLALAIDAVALRLQTGGRLIYVGAGTSGRLGALDAAECPPTFQSDPAQVQAILAGGQDAMLRAVEGAEDDREAGAHALSALNLETRDAVVGISASGGAPFVHAALEVAQRAGALTIGLACTARSDWRALCKIPVHLDCGPELLAGSTRMKAGTATKVALHTLSTMVMARLGKVHGHRMIDVHTQGNQKLWRRGVRMVADLTGRTEDAAEALLVEADGSVKLAAAMHAGNFSSAEARDQLARADGHLARLIANLGV